MHTLFRRTAERRRAMQWTGIAIAAVVIAIVEACRSLSQ